MTSIKWLIISACALLTSCRSGSDDGTGAFCESISGGGAELVSSCTGCTLTNAGAAADDNLVSAANAAVGSTSTSASATFRATAQDGVVYAAGYNAGVFFTADTGLCGGCALTINTYLDGVPQETGAGVTNSDAEGRGTPAQKYSSISATLPFDAVEINAAGTTVPGNPGVFLQVYEICSNGGVRE